MFNNILLMIWQNWNKNYCVIMTNFKSKGLVTFNYKYTNIISILKYFLTRNFSPFYSLISSTKNGATGVLIAQCTDYLLINSLFPFFPLLRSTIWRRPSYICSMNNSIERWLNGYKYLVCFLRHLIVLVSCSNEWNTILLNLFNLDTFLTLADMLV